MMSTFVKHVCHNTGTDTQCPFRCWQWQELFQGAVCEKLHENVHVLELFFRFKYDYIMLLLYIIRFDRIILIVCTSKTIYSGVVVDNIWITYYFI